MEMTLPVVEVAAPSSAGSPDPIPIPHPLVCSPLGSPPPYPSVRRGVQRAMRGRGTKHHPYLIDIWPQRPRGLSPSSHLDRRDHLRYSHRIPTGYSGGSSGSDSELESERSFRHVTGFSTPKGDCCSSRGGQGVGRVRSSPSASTHGGAGQVRGVSPDVGRVESSKL